MRAIDITELKSGQRFSFTGNPEKGFPCVALQRDTDEMIKKGFNGSVGNLWHVYLPSGCISWSRPEHGTVWVE